MLELQSARCSANRCLKKKDSLFEKLKGEKLDPGTIETLFKFFEQIMDELSSSDSKSDRIASDADDLDKSGEVNQTSMTNRDNHIKMSDSCSDILI